MKYKASNVTRSRFVELQLYNEPFVRVLHKFKSGFNDNWKGAKGGNFFTYSDELGQN